MTSPYTRIEIFLHRIRMLLALGYSQKEATHIALETMDRPPGA